MKTLISMALIIILSGFPAWTQTVRAESWEEFQRNKTTSEQGSGLVAKKSKIIPKGVILEKLKTTREVVFESDSIQFAYGSSVVQESSTAQLAEIAAALTESEEFREAPVFFVDGHCCSIGSDENNCRLSLARARAVIDALTKTAEIPESKLKARGFGKRTPAFSNDTEEERSRNRRVVLKSRQAPGAIDDSKVCEGSDADVADTVPNTPAPNAPGAGTSPGVAPGSPEVFPDVETRGSAPKSPGFLPSRKPAGSKRMQGERENNAASKVKQSIPWAGRTAPAQDPNLPEGFIKSKKQQ